MNWVIVHKRLIELMKFMKRQVRLQGDITHQEYSVLGLNWTTENLLLSGENGNFWVHHSKVTLVPEEDDEEGWYTP